MDLAAIKAIAARVEDVAPVTLPLDDLTDLHVDGDYAAYYFAGNDETLLSDSKRNFINFVLSAQQIAGAGGNLIVHITAASSDKGKRYVIATVKDYQGQRDSSRRPKNWEGMRDWLEASKTLPGTNFRVVTWDDREADDGAAAAARYAWQGGRKPVLLSRDKDFRMIPGLHVTWTTLERHAITPETYESRGPDGEVYGQKWFWMQMLAGDTADNIPGLEKQPAKGGGFKTCGMACAETWLLDARNSSDAYKVVRDLYQRYYGGQWADRLVEQAALLWLRTDNKADPADFYRAVPFRDLDVEKAIQTLIRRLRNAD